MQHAHALGQLLSWTVWLTLLASGLALIPLQFIQQARIKRFTRRISQLDFEDPESIPKALQMNAEAKGVPYFEKILHRLARAVRKEKGLIAELNAARDYTDLLLESVGEAILVFDQKGRLQDFNAVSEKLFGLSAYRHVGTTPLFLAQDKDTFYRDLEAVTKAIDEKGIFKGDLRIRAASGEFIHADTTVAPVGSYSELGRALYISAIRDISVRHKALKDLEESEQRYRLVTDGSPLGIYIFQDGRLVFANQRLASILDSSVEELLANNIWDYFEPADRQLIQSKAKRNTRALPSGQTAYETKLRTASGEEKWLEVSDCTFLLKGRPATIGNVKDITESRLARQEARNRLREIEVMGRISALANKAEDVETMFNKAVSEMNEIIGLRGGCVLLENSYDDSTVIKCQEDAPNWMMDYAKRLAEVYRDTAFPDRGIESFPAEDINGPIGMSVCLAPLKSADRPIGCLLMWGDSAPDHNTARFVGSVSLELGATVERLRLVQALRLSEQRYRDLFENAGDLIEAVDDQGRYVYVNRRWMEVLGYTEDEIHDLRVSDVVDPAWLGTFKNLIDKVRQVGAVDDADLVYLRKDGSQVRLEGSITARIRGGQVAYTRAMFRDVTTNRMLQEQMQRAQRIESLAIMAGGMAHDFNNVLMAVLGNISIMIAEAEPGTKMHQRLSNVEQQALAGCSVTRQLLNIARTQEPACHQINLTSMLDGIVEVVRRTRRGLSVEVDVDENLPVAKGDEGQLHQVFMNLLINAAQATKDGGRISVKATQVRIDQEQAQARDLEKGKYLMIEVSDNGSGISEADIKRIFDPFFSTKDRNRGTGLGLTMAFRTVKQHDGYIGVESILGQGTAFTVLLPASGKAKAQTRAVGSQGPEAMASARGKTIMVVDDEEGVRQIIADMLRLSGAEVLEASDGRLAKNMLESRNCDVDLIVLDMIMPDMDGTEFYQWLTDSSFDSPVLFATGNGLNPTIEKNISSDRCHYIAKPFRLTDFTVKLGEIFGGRQAN